jgi:hypothetical protein
MIDSKINGSGRKPQGTDVPVSRHYRLIERPWEAIPRRRYAIERFVYRLEDGTEHWSLEQFFENVLEAQCYLARLRNGPRMISEVTVSEKPA